MDRRSRVAAVAHADRSLPLLAVAYVVKQMTRSPNQAEESCFLIGRTLGRALAADDLDERARRGHALRCGDSSPLGTGT